MLRKIPLGFTKFISLLYYMYINGLQVKKLRDKPLFEDVLLVLSQGELFVFSLLHHVCQRPETRKKINEQIFLDYNPL